MPRGFLDTKFIDLPANIDANYLRGLVTARGISFASLLTQLDARLRAINAAVDPLVSQLFSYTTEASTDDSMPTQFLLEEENEYGLPRPEIAERQAHMLPLRRYAKSLAFTEDFLEQALQQTIINQFDSMAGTFVRGIKMKTLERLTSVAEVRVDRGTTATSPGFAGSGTGASIFTGTYPNGAALAGSYTLYYRDTSANLAVAIKAARDELKKWWPGPYDLITSSTQLALIAALTDFVRTTPGLVNPATGVATTPLDPVTYAGVYDGDIRVRIAQMEYGTEPNITIFKTFGAFSQQNPLVYRYDPDFGRGVVIRSRELYPLDQAVMRLRFGIGVKNRVAAANIRIGASGGYVAPVIV
jgi:hypothetical protein